MGRLGCRLTIAALLLAPAHPAAAQTADEVIERSVRALGGRDAHAKLVSRSIEGTITFSIAGGEYTGPVEILHAAPNKVRTLIRVDLSTAGAGQVTIDQRFDGQAGYVIDSSQGTRETTGSQLDSLRNGAFPHLFLSYKAMGMTSSLAGKESLGGRETYVVVFQPKQGAAIRQYIDAETYLPSGALTTVNVPQLGKDVAQMTEASDFRDVDGVKVPFRLQVTSPVQNVTLTMTKIQHNVAVDEALFGKPPAP